MSIDAMKQALEALDGLSEQYDILRAQDALRAAIKEAQEPVAGKPLPCPFCGASDGLTMTDGSTYRWGYAYCSNCGASAGETRREYPDDGKWYQEAIQQWNQRTTPPRREWQGLTEVEIVGLTCECVDDGTFNMDCALDFARAIEAKLKEKNT